TQLVTDALIGERESLENLIGATFVFGMRSEAEAARALTLLGLDADDPRLRQFLLELEAGRCLLRDHQGRVEAIEVDLVAPSLRGGRARSVRKPTPVPLPREKWTRSSATVSAALCAKARSVGRNCRARAGATAKRRDSSRRLRRPGTTGSTFTSTRAFSGSA